jgi:hypothetical protein
MSLFCWPSDNETEKLPISSQHQTVPKKKKKKKKKKKEKKERGRKERNMKDTQILTISSRKKGLFVSSFLSIHQLTPYWYNKERKYLQMEHYFCFKCLRYDLLTY